MASYNEVTAETATLDNGGRFYSRTFLVKIDSVDSASARSAGQAIPVAIGSQHPDDADAYCVRVAPRVTPENRLWYFVDCEYRTVLRQNAFPNPVSWHPKVNWGSEQFDEVVEKDRDGTAITNSAGDPFDPPLTETRSRSLLTLQRNESTWDPDWPETYENSVNDASITICGKVAAAGTALIRRIGAEYQEANGYEYWSVTYVIAFKSDGWDREVLDAGYYRAAKTGETERPRIERDGMPVTEPARLDGSGGKLADASASVFLSFNTKSATDWSVFNLPTAVAGIASGSGSGS